MELLEPGRVFVSFSPKPPQININCPNAKKTLNSLFVYLNESEYIFQKEKFKTDSFFTMYQDQEKYVIHLINETKIQSVIISINKNSVTNFYNLENSQLYYFQTDGSMFTSSNINFHTNMVSFGRFMNDSENLCLFGIFQQPLSLNLQDETRKLLNIENGINNSNCPYLLNIQYLDEHLVYPIYEIEKFAQKNKLVRDYSYCEGLKI